LRHDDFEVRQHLVEVVAIAGFRSRRLGGLRLRRALWLGTWRLRQGRLLRVTLIYEHRARQHEADQRAGAKLAQPAEVPRAPRRALVVASRQPIHRHYMLSGADTPNSARPLRITCATERPSAARALRTSA